MGNKGYQNTLTKPRQNDYRKVLLERLRLEREKLEQEEADSNRRHISTYYGGTNVGD